MSKEMYFSPLEDVTGYLFRNLHKRMFGGADRYYAPFISAVEPERKIKRRELEDTAPVNNWIKDSPLFDGKERERLI